MGVWGAHFQDRADRRDDTPDRLVEAAAREVGLAELLADAPPGKPGAGADAGADRVATDRRTGYGARDSWRQPHSEASGQHRHGDVSFTIFLRMVTPFGQTASQDDRGRRAQTPDFPGYICNSKYLIRWSQTRGRDSDAVRDIVGGNQPRARLWGRALTEPPKRGRCGPKGGRGGSSGPRLDLSRPTLGRSPYVGRVLTST